MAVLAPPYFNASEGPGYNGPERRRSDRERRLSLAGSRRQRDELAPEISVVMPCLNEHESVGLCVEKAWAGIRATGLRGEVIVSDNGSTDGSADIALAKGARVVHQPSPATATLISRVSRRLAAG